MNVSERERVSKSQSFDFLEAAIRIGERITSEAVWHETSCNWIGAIPFDNRKGYDSPRYATLGITLYSGVSGIAIFLSELYHVTSSEVFRRTALGSLDLTLKQLADVPSEEHNGLYAGLPGVALSLGLCSVLLRDEYLLSECNNVIDVIISSNKKRPEFDLISGNAGAIIALIILLPIVSRPEIIDFAKLLGDELIDSAEKTDTSYSWRSKNIPSTQNLTGFSHGTAGVATAFLELYCLTEEARFLTAAQASFTYERMTFSAEAKNWPDFRKFEESMPSGGFATFWCHGAPGIAISRLRAYEILNDELYRQEALIALQTTERTLTSSLHSHTGNFSLCHGLSGNAQVLSYGQEVLGGDVISNQALPQLIAIDGHERYLKFGKPWPCGTWGGETPDLMLGLSGIGLFYLHFFQPSCFSGITPVSKRSIRRKSIH